MAQQLVHSMLNLMLGDLPSPETLLDNSKDQSPKNINWMGKSAE